VGPTVDGVFREDDLKRVVLPAIAEQAGVRIETDATIKATRVSATLRGATVPAALQKILENTGYTFKEKEDGYLVFRPVTNTFLGDPLREALQQMGLSAGVTIALDENVTGEAYADLTDVPIEEALEIVLAGTPYVVIKKPNYFVVALRDPDSGAFPQISVTRQYHANYTTPARAKALLAPAFAKYVQTDNDPNSHLLTVTAPPEMAKRIIEDIKRVDLRPRHVLLDARIVSMERGDLLNLGIDWGFPTARAGVFGDAYVDGDRAAGDVSTDWPFGIQVGFSFDRTFTDSLVAAINLLKENSQADIISSPQVLAQDGRMSEIRVITEENYALTPPLDVLGNTGFFTQTEFQTIESGTTLSITPLIGDNNDITLQMAIEVSDSIPSARGTQLPVVTRRQARNAVTIRDGGTVALAGLTENRSRSNERKVPGLSGLPLIGGLFKNDENDKATREIAVFVTARLVPDQPRAYQPAAAGLDREPGRERSAAVVPAGEDIRLQIRESLSRQQ
jgi:type II secretory pathway component HofQ